MSALNVSRAAALVVLRFVLIAPAALGEDALQEGSQCSMNLLQVKADDALKTAMAASPETDGDKAPVLVQRKTKQADVEEDASAVQVSSQKTESELGALSNLFSDARTYQIYIDLSEDRSFPFENLKCGLEWDSSLLLKMQYHQRHDPNAQVNERLAKWDCKKNADPVFFVANPDNTKGPIEGKIYAKVGDKKCGLEWSGEELTGVPGRRAAKWDCEGRADPVYFVQTSTGKPNEFKYYAKVRGITCGLTWAPWWEGKELKSDSDELAAVWDCRQHVDEQDLASAVFYE